MSDIIAALRARALATPSRVAVDDGHRSLCCADLDRRIGEIATLFRRNDCRVIGLLADNGIAWIVADLAALAAGGTLVPIPPYFTAMQLEHVVATSDIDTMLVADPAAAERLAAAGFETADAGLDEFTLLRRPVLEQADTEDPARPAKITFTSGSTGQPKGVCLSAATIDRVISSRGNRSQSPIRRSRSSITCRSSSPRGIAT